MIKFIRHFINEWFNYPSFVAWSKAHFTEEQLREMERTDAQRGIKPIRNRFDYAWKNAKIHYAHRDRYGRKCKKNGGDCNKCNAKHC